MYVCTCLSIVQEWTPEAIKSMELVGDVKGRDCIIFDDLVDSAGRITKAAAKLKAAGARRIFAFATHGLFTGRAIERIEKSELIEVACSNTLPHASGRVGGVTTWEMCGKVHHLSVGALLAEAIRRINEKESISELFF
jgi:ribose-phosphate pyrophosphokinase